METSDSITPRVGSDDSRDGLDCRRSLVDVQPHGNAAMTDNIADETRDAVHSYAYLRTDGGEYIIYDPENPTAWIQSDTTTTKRA